MQCAESDSDSIAASVGEVLAVSELLPSLSLSHKRSAHRVLSVYSCSLFLITSGAGWMNTPNPNDARLSGQSAAGSAKEMTDAEKVAVVEKAKGMFASDDWVLGLALSKAEPEKRVEVVKVFTDLLEKKA